MTLYSKFWEELISDFSLKRHGQHTHEDIKEVYTNRHIDSKVIS
jgi:hypothetical protein